MWVSRRDGLGPSTRSARAGAPGWNADSLPAAPPATPDPGVSDSSRKSSTAASTMARPVLFAATKRILMLLVGITSEAIGNATRRQDASLWVKRSTFTQVAPPSLETSVVQVSAEIVSPALTNQRKYSITGLAMPAAEKVEVVSSLDVNTLELASVKKHLVPGPGVWSSSGCSGTCCG